MINSGQVPAGDISGAKVFNHLLSTVTQHGAPTWVAGEETCHPHSRGPLMAKGQVLGSTNCENVGATVPGRLAPACSPPRLLAADCPQLTLTPVHSSSSPPEHICWIAICCRKGDRFQGPRVSSCLTLGNELSEETHMLTHAPLLGRGAQAESRRVRGPRWTALTRGSKARVY